MGYFVFFSHLAKNSGKILYFDEVEIITNYYLRFCFSYD